MGFFLNSQSTPLTNRSFIKFIFNWRKICHTITQIILLIHIFPPSPHSSRSSQSTRLRFLCYTATSHQLSILHNSIYISTLFSPFVLPSPSPLGPQVPSLHVHLHSFPSNRSISTIFLDSIYIWVNIWYLFFYFWLISLCITDSRFIHLSLTQ